LATPISEGLLRNLHRGLDPVLEVGDVGEGPPVHIKADRRSARVPEAVSAARTAASRACRREIMR
jgi:hypothetical protein